MEITESIESLNRQLVDEYGLETSTNQPIFRIVWADDEMEIRLCEFTESGISLSTPESRRVKKYPFFKGLYVLEHLVAIPPMNAKDLPDKKLSYEPIWTYCNANRYYVPPTWQATKFVVDTVYAALGKKSLAKYREEAEKLTVEAKNKRIAKLQEELFGNETPVGDALAHKTGVVVPSNKSEVKK